MHYVYALLREKNGIKTIYQVCQYYSTGQEAWRRRRYEGAFIDKLNISESEAAETQVWLEYAVKCKYLDREIGRELNKIYDNIIGKLVTMANDPKPWMLKAKMSR